MFQRTKVGAAAALAVSGIALSALPASAQQQLERVEITGSSIKSIHAETALPVTIVTKEEIARSGATSTEQLLQTISAVSSQGALSGAIGTSISTYGQSSISLRGLGEDRTLVLVNGRRLAAFAGGNGAAINVNAIPLAAIDRVEVLKDGASGVYGSDAIAGVVNFILTKDFQGVELGASLGAPTRSGGGKNTRATIVAGFGDVATNRFNLTLSATLEKDTALFGRDREFARTVRKPPFFNTPGTGQGNIEGAYNPSNGTTPYDPAAENATQFVPPANTQILAPPGNTPGRQVRTNPAFPSPPGTAVEDQASPNLVLFGNTPGSGFGNPLAATNQCETISMFLFPDPTTTGAPYCQFDTGPFANLIPKRELGNLSANLIFKLTDNLELFGDALYSRSRVTQVFQPSPIRRDFNVSDTLFPSTGVNPVLLIRPTNPNYALAASYLAAQDALNPGQGFGDLIGQPLAVTSRVFDFGPRIQDDTAKQSRVVAGVRGNFLKQDYEVAATANSNKVHGTVPGGHFSQTGLSRVVNDPASDYNPWSLTQSAAFQSALAAAAVQYTGTTLDAESKSRTIEGKLSGDVLALPAGPLQYAAGLQSRKEDLVLNPSAALLSGDIAGLGGATLPVDRDRKIDSVYAELNVPIIKSLEGNVALRNDHYDDVGSSSNYKASLRWQPIPQVLLRGSAGTGFRAPTLLDLWQPQALGSSEQFNDPATGQTDLQVNSLTGGNPTLKPEKSRQRTLGIVLQPMQNLTVSVDYFNIRVEDIIALPSAQEVVSRFRAGDPAFAGLVALSGNNVDSIVQTLQNVGSAKVKGVDIEAGFRQNFGPGRLDLNLSGTYMIKFDQTSPGGALSRKVGTIVEPDGTPVLSTQAQVLDGVVLRWKHYLSATWSQGPWAFTLAQNFYKGYRDSNDLNDEPHRVPDQSIYDAQVAFTGIKNLKLAIGAKNLFDKDPPIFIPSSNQFQQGYDVTQYDPRARFVYVNASYKF